MPRMREDSPFFPGEEVIRVSRYNQHSGFYKIPPDDALFIFPNCWMVTSLACRIEVGSVVEITQSQFGGIALVGKQGIVTSISADKLISVRLDNGVIGGHLRCHHLKLVPLEDYVVDL